MGCFRIFFFVPRVYTTYGKARPYNIYTIMIMDLSWLIIVNFDHPVGFIRKSDLKTGGPGIRKTPL